MSKSRVYPVPLKDIKLDHRLQCREVIDQDTVAEYAAAIKAGAQRSGRPPRVYLDSEGWHWLADGYHWYRASEAAGKRGMACEVVKGEYADALRYAVGANADHGRARTPGDRRKAVLTCLANKELKKLSSRAIADLCKVGHELVDRIRAENKTKAQARQGKDGKVYQAGPALRTGKKTPTEKPAPAKPKVYKCPSCACTMQLAT